MELTDEELEVLQETRPQDIHDDVLPLEGTLYAPDEEDYSDLIHTSYYLLMGLVERKLPKQVTSEIRAHLKDLSVLVNWHRVH